jgi:polyhydroxyalkanoate synthase
MVNDNKPGTPPETSDVFEWTENSIEILKKTQEVMTFLLSKMSGKSHFYDLHTCRQAMESYNLLIHSLLSDPQKMWSIQLQWLNDSARLWQQYVLGHSFVEQEDDALKSDTLKNPGDKRFRAEEWQTHPYFSYLKQAYLLTADYLSDLVYKVEGLDPKASQQLKFYTHQFIDALSPSNFLLTNPSVLNRTIETAGANLVKGLENMLEDLKENEGRFKISMTDMKAFTVGKDLAVTPGKVVYENRLFQLIQYSPTTKEVYQTPVLMTSPWINKYYILDMKPENSFVKATVDQGYTVFMVSWVNPDASYGETTFDDYLTQGLLMAIEVVQSITKQKKINLAAYCVGGTLMACALAYLAQKKQDIVNSATFLTTLVDFAEPGDIGVFIDDAQISTIEDHMAVQGYLDGRDMALTFNTLRANDLIWSYFVSNYLEGKEPFAFDLLFWNNDAANLAAKTHSFYLREFYLKNKLREPGGIALAGVPLELNLVNVPIYSIATEQDHIAPWRSVYSGLQLFTGKKRFVLGGSGHIAGIINPPAKNKYGYRVSDQLVANPDDWYEASTQCEGSWWTDWYQWLKKQSGPKVKPPTMGNKNYPALADAPGSYVVKQLSSESEIKPVAKKGAKTKS